MCGIAGIVKTDEGVSPDVLARMIRSLQHRGPDGESIWISDCKKVGFGHSRLSIIDLSDSGKQPMASPDGRYQITFNGEIYNYPKLWNRLRNDGVQFRGNSDTEVVLAALDRWGVAAALPHLSGMFAMAVYDRYTRETTLVRDRIGIKPLYYCATKKELLFASELKPLVLAKGAVPPLSPTGLSEFLQFGYVRGSQSIFDGIFRLEPGHMVRFSAGGLSPPTPYWTLADVITSPPSNTWETEGEAVDVLDDILRHSIERHMISDVPFGAFLSGGIDSSTVVSLMQNISTSPVKTFSIGFEMEGYNEAQHAAAVARHLKTDHHELYVTEDDAMAVIPDLADMYDEPFADASQIPTFMVSRLARENVKVALSGDGGDELFAGYNRYMFVANFWNRLKALPIPLRRFVASCLRLVPASGWDRVFEALSLVLPGRFVPPLPGQKIHKTAAILPSNDLESLYGRLVSQWSDPNTILHPAWREQERSASLSMTALPGLQPVESQMYWDSQGYLVDDILTKVDRASMRVGLEARVPLLDPEVVSFAWSLPIGMKIKGNVNKWVLRQVLYKYVPAELIDRPKMGFSVPINHWLSGPMKAWASSLLDRELLEEHGILDAGQVTTIFQRHVSGSVDASGQLWTILMLNHWLMKVRSWV